MDTKFYVYILTNKHHKVLYTGITDNIPRRTFEHQTKKYNSFTKRYNVEKLVYFEEHTNASDASAREMQIKGWIRKKKVELIESINPEWIGLTFEVNQNEIK